jgi:transcriptional regulator
MYIPKHFDEPRVEVLHELMRARPLAALVTLAPHGLEANHLPLRLLPQPGPLGTLRGHVARANALWRDCAAGADVLAIFQGPDAYITPSWYETKAETGKAVPTWNYAVAHAYGRLRVVDDAAWLRAEVEALTAEHEAAFAPPWQVTDAPADYVDAMIAAVVGIEIEITRLAGKWKLSQNHPARNRAGVRAGLRARGDAASAEMAAWIEGGDEGR